MTTISITNSHGTFTTPAASLDVLIRRCLTVDAMTVPELRMVLGHAARTTRDTYSDVCTAVELLIMLASTDSPQPCRYPGCFALFDSRREGADPGDEGGLLTGWYWPVGAALLEDPELPAHDHAVS